MHHRRSWRQRREVAEDGSRIAFGPTAPPFLARSFAEQLLLGDYREPSCRQQEPAHIRRRGEAEPGVAGEECRPVGRGAGRKALAAQHLGEHLAPAGRVGSDQHAALEAAGESRELFERLRRPRVGAQLRRRARAEIDEGHRASDRLDLDRGDDDPRMRLERRDRFRGRHESLLRRQQGSLPVVPVLFVPRGDVGPLGVERRPEADQIDDHAARRQVCGESRRVAEEERQPGLDARRNLAGRDGAIDTARLRITFETLAPPAAERGDRFGGCRNLACRQERDRREPLAGPLVRRVEGTHRFDQVVEQVETVGPRRAGRVQVQDGAAYRELARAQDLGDLRITGVHQPGAQGRQVDALARRQGKCVGRDERLRREPVEEGCLRRDDDVALQSGQGGERREPLGDDVRMRRERIIGQRFAVGE